MFSPDCRSASASPFLYVSIIVCLPLGALVFKAASLGFEDYWRIVSAPRAVASYRVTIGAAAVATAFNVVFGFALAWVLVRYRFPGRRLLDALVDLPFALPTAVAGIALTTCSPRTAGYGAPLAALGIKVAFTPLGIHGGDGLHQPSVHRSHRAAPCSRISSRRSRRRRSASGRARGGSSAR